MGMGVYGVSGYTISLDNLREICPEETKAVEVLGVDWGTIAQATNGDLDEDTARSLADFDIELETANKIIAAAEVLCATFKERTGLGVSLYYYDEDMGDRYDNVSHEGGCVFLLYGVTMLTPAAERMGDKIESASWTSVG